MAGREPEPYRFEGTERAVPDPQRYERAMRAWAAYAVGRTSVAANPPGRVPRRRDRPRAG